MNIRSYVTNCRFPCVSHHVLIALCSLLGCYFFLGLPFSLPLYAKLLLVCCLVGVYSFTVNNHFDRFADRFNPVKLARNPVAAGLITPENSMLFNTGLAAATFFLWMTWFPSAAPFLVLMLANATLYSRTFKNRPILDLLSHGTGLILYVIFPALVLGAGLVAITIAAFAVLGLSNMFELENQIADYRADRAAGMRTTTVRYGIVFARSLFVASACLLMAGIIVFYLFFPNWYVLLLLPWPALKAVRAGKTGP